MPERNGCNQTPEENREIIIIHVGMPFCHPIIIGGEDLHVYDELKRPWPDGNEKRGSSGRHNARAEAGAANGIPGRSLDDSTDKFRPARRAHIAARNRTAAQGRLSAFFHRRSRGRAGNKGL